MKIQSLTRLFQGKTLSLYQLTMAADTDLDQDVITTEFSDPDPNLTAETLAENYSPDRVSILIRAVHENKIILGGGDIMSRRMALYLPHIIEPDNNRKRAAVLDFLRENFHINHVMKTSLTHFGHTVKTGADPTPEWLAVVDVDGDNNWFSNEYHWATRGIVIRQITGQQAMPDWLRGMLTGWVYMPHDTVSVSLLNGWLRAITIQDPKHPGIAIDYVRPDGTSIRLALTEFVSELIDATPDYGEDQIEIPFQRLTADCKQITPGLVTRAYPKMDIFDDEQHRTFHYTD